MSEIEINEYVRTEYGYILENTWNGNQDVIKKLVNRDSHYEFKYGKIVKHSKNIINLIDKSDFVNGYKVIDIQEGYLYIDKTNPKTELLETLVDYQIKTILTHEMYKNNCYKVEE